MPAFSEISPAKLMRLIGTPEVPVLVDVSIDEDFTADPRLIPSAIRQRHDQIDKIATLAGGQSSGLAGGRRPVVVICQKGRKLSHGVAARLRALGLSAEVLAGGNFGWRDAGLPRCDTGPLPAIQHGGTRWVTRHRPKIDRIACPWLIRRFIDPGAEFLFVPPADVADIADRFDAIAFDTDIAPWTHRDAFCTFDVMVQGFGLSHPPLDHMARIIRAADTDSHDLEPQAAGLLALSVGLSRMYRDDTAQLQAGMTLYDALFRWARDGVAETHDWPAGHPQ